MAYPQVIIPPSVKPVSPLELAPADDQTVSFQPRFARGTTQRQTWGDPIWSAQVRFESLSGADRALLKAAVAGARGGASNILMTPGIPLRGSFPATEVYTNSDFRNGTTGWSVPSDNTLSVSDGVARAIHNGTKSTGYIEIYQSVTLTQYAPYCARVFYDTSNWPITTNVIGQYMDGNNYAANVSGMNTYANVNVSSGSQSVFPLVAQDSTGVVAGQRIDMPYVSLARCILADAGPNALIQSTALEDTGAWGRSQISNITSGGTAPDGTATARSIIENGSAGSHYIAQSVAVAAAAADFTFSVYLKVGTRGFGYIQLVEATGGTAAYSYLNLSSGSWDSEATGANWSNLRKHINDYGNGWYRFSITARKTNGATTISVLVGIASAANTGSYTGDGASYIQAWGASLAQSGVPARYVATTATATAGTSQTGSSIYVKGLPVSTSGLLLAGDFVEINGELMQVTASLDSDAAGLGVLQIHRRPTTAIADNIPIIVNNPFGTFRLASDPRITERFGVYTDVDLQLIEATA